MQKKSSDTYVAGMRLKGMKAEMALKNNARLLPFPHSKPFMAKYEKPGGIKQLRKDTNKVQYDETQNFRMEDGVRYGHSKLFGAR